VPHPTSDIALLGREAECAKIDAQLELVRSGWSTSLLLRGEAGIGKTVLLQYASERAADMKVLTARGIGSESEIPFSGLLDLARPILDRLDEIPAPQAAALAGALALGPPVKGDRFTISAATLSLLAAAAAEGPLAVVVDDFQWLDTASAEALLFAARRLDAEPVALLFAIRDGEALSFDTGGLPELRVEGLDREASLSLLRTRFPGRISETVTERLFLETGGNPLALVEVHRLLSPEQLEGREELETPLPACASIERVYARRIAELPEGTQTALLVAAASASPHLEPVLAAQRELGLPADSLEPAESAGLVEISDLQIEFCHPLARSSVYHGASAGSRRTVHRALASAFAASDDGAGERAWHLAAASLEPDEEVAQALEEAAAAARRRSGFAAAASAFERAARLTPDGNTRARRLLAAAEACQLANRSERASGLLDEALTLAEDPLLRADIQHLRGSIGAIGRSGRDAFRLLCDEAEKIELIAPERAAMMLADATTGAINGADLLAGVEAARHAHELARPLGGMIELLTALGLGKVLVLSGDAQSGGPLIMRYAELLDESDPLAHGLELAFCTPILMCLEEYAAAEHVISTVIAAARAANALGLLPYCLGAQAELEVRTGRWSSAYANGFESVHLAREAGQEGQLSYNLARLAQLEAAQGREDACRAHVAEGAELAEKHDYAPTFSFIFSALGLLELGLGRPERAIEHLEEIPRFFEKYGALREPGRLEWRDDLVEAYIRTGRRAEAEGMLDAFEREAEHFGRTRILAVASRCHGLLAEEADVDDCFAAAFRWHERVPGPFERARTELCYGERLRRQGRRIDAREQLRPALACFERLGAAPWAQRARTELAATGENVGPRRDALSEELTSQELQVALIVAKGATNKEAGAALFLTPKTIEFHLAKIYRKLGLRSRTELARHFAEEPVASTNREPSS
jgi:DNA-binding CsgD family transcriptional regulator